MRPCGFRFVERSVERSKAGGQRAGLSLEYDQSLRLLYLGSVSEYDVYYLFNEVFGLLMCVRVAV